MEVAYQGVVEQKQELHQAEEASLDEVGVVQASRASVVGPEVPSSLEQAAEPSASARTAVEAQGTVAVA